MANAKDEKDADAAPAEKKKFPRRCAKCATPKPNAHFQNDGSFTPYCTSCRTRFPSLRAARVLVTALRSTKKR